MLKLGVLVSGGGTNLQAIMDAIAEKRLNAEIVLAVSSRKSAYALTRAETAGIDACFVDKKLYENPVDYSRALISLFETKRVEIIVAAGFKTVLPSDFIRHFENRVVNVHCALAPAFCGLGFYGLKVHEAALEKGVKITGATVHFATDEVDGGPIILQKAVEVRDGDTPETLQQRVMAEAEHVILAEALELIAQGRVLVEGKRTRIV